MYSVSTPGTANNRYETATWPVLQDLAANKPEAGVHFQGLHSVFSLPSKAHLFDRLLRISAREGCRDACRRLGVPADQGESMVQGSRTRREMPQTM